MAHRNSKQLVAVHQHEALGLLEAVHQHEALGLLEKESIVGTGPSALRPQLTTGAFFFQKIWIEKEKSNLKESSYAQFYIN